MKTILQVTVLLPYYVPVPDDFTLTYTQLANDETKIIFRRTYPDRVEAVVMEIGAVLDVNNMDDRKGTYIRSWCRVLLPITELPDLNKPSEFMPKILPTINNALRTIRYKANDPAIYPVNMFQYVHAEIHEFEPDGTVKLPIKFSESHNFEPYSLLPIRELPDYDLEDVQKHVNGLPVLTTWHLLLDAEYHSSLGDIIHACLDLAMALETHIDNLIIYYRNFYPTIELNLEDKTIWWMYDKGLAEITGHSLHETPDHYISLEYIYAIRNSIAHAWKAEFRISESMKKYSRYLDHHQKKNGHEVTEVEEMKELISAAREIVSHTIHLFETKYPTI
jgi:hypothetical protein